ncbi:hypothetical protein D9M71_777760 [compost metagenome]
MSRIRVRRFCLASPSNTLATDSISSRKLARLGDRLSRPDSMRVMSSTSPINSSRLFAEVWAISILARSIGWLSARLSASSRMPITAFIGVRISWLMVARKVVLARLASSAWTFASRNCSTN